MDVISEECSANNVTVTYKQDAQKKGKWVMLMVVPFRLRANERMKGPNSTDKEITASNRSTGDLHAIELHANFFFLKLFLP